MASSSIFQLPWLLASLGVSIHKEGIFKTIPQTQRDQELMFRESDIKAMAIIASNSMSWWPLYSYESDVRIQMSESTLVLYLNSSASLSGTQVSLSMAYASMDRPNPNPSPSLI